MNKFLIFLIIIIFIILFAIKIYSIGSNSLSSYSLGSRSLGSRSLGSRSLEHLTNQSDEAIQNLASLYNKDELTIGKLNVTGDSSVTGNITGGTLTDKSMGKTVKEYIDFQIANLTNQINGVSARVTTAQNGVNASVKKNAELKLKSTSGSEHAVCNGGYVMSGGNCGLMNGGGTYHQGAWATEARRVKFVIEQ